VPPVINTVSIIGGQVNLFCDLMRAGIFRNFISLYEQMYPRLVLFLIVDSLLFKSAKGHILSGSE
jgi:hypothetical protein